MKQYYLKLLLIPLFAISIQLYGQTPSTMEFGSSTVVIANSSNPSHDFSSNSLSASDNAKLNGFDMSATTSGSIFLAFALDGNSAGTSIIGAPSDAVLGWIGNAAASVIDGTLKTDTGGEIGMTSMHFAYEIAGGSSPSSFTFTGKKDGVTVGTLVLNSPAALSDITLDFTSPTTGSFANIDEIIFKPSSAILGGFSIDGIVIVAAVSNTAPIIAGTSAGQAVNDNATVTPFSAITTTDADGDNLSATITLDTNAKGVLSGTGLTGTGPYAIASTTAADLQTKLRALSFNPTDNRTSTTETTTFTVVINDATVTDTDNTTTVISSAVAPTISSVNVPSNATYTAGQNLDFTVNFNENITVVTTGGTPQIAVTIGATVRQAAFVSGSGSGALLFRYTVQNDDLDTNGIAIGALATNGGTLRDSGNANATLTLNSVGSTANVLVDASAPTVSSVSVPSNATYTTGQNLDFTVNFNENITVITTGGTPQIAITIGAIVRQAAFVSGSGSGALLFRYTVQNGDLDTNGIAVGALASNGGTLRDAASNDATLTLNSVGSTASILVDANTPILSSSNPADGSTGVVISQNIVLTFNENISKGTGNILIKKTSDNSTIETIDVTTAAVTVSTNTATINPSSDFDLNTGYYIQIDNTTFKDAANNNYAGIADATSLNFTSEANQTNSYAVASGNWSVPSNWSLGRLPISSDDVNVGTNTINLDVSNASINDLSISIGGSFNILSGQSITVNGNLNQNGTLNILSNASNNGSLIVKGNHTGISNVDYHRYLSTNWHLIASPIAGKNISDFTGNLNTSGNKYSIAPYQNNVVSASRWNYYTTAAGANNIATAGTFTIGKGYSIQKSTGGTLNFSGTLNTTDKTFAITDGGDDPAGNRWNLVGNPFTASLNGSNAADATNNFLKVNIDAGNLDPSRAGLYLWNGTAYVEKSVDDAAFYIAPGQGFFVHAPDAGGTSVSFTEAMETHQTGNVFLRGSGKSYPEIVLNINEGKNSSSTKIRYINNKTKGLDPGSDVGTFTGTNASFKVFSHLIDNNKGIDFAIQALPNQDYESTIIPIGLKAKAGKAVVFSAEVSNLPNGIEMYLEDRVNNTFKNLSKEDYTITLKTDTNSIGQFYIHTSAKNLEVVDVKQNLENVSIYKSANNTLTVAGLQTNKASVNVYSILGQKVISTALKSSGSHVIELPKAATGVYIVELNSSLGKISKKIILE
ncbi:Ig-like domain-containing protein [Tenacibaculum ovolyticum]|uniref:Ig-like domain-containing protein n=1 Tax=Tenacibaculum ovolyticum TaxID=104270 RepID=UPI001F3987E5|nr:Ig-like domain-containing protein [Tenacibaculum ovolyticum]